MKTAVVLIAAALLALPVLAQDCPVHGAPSPCPKCDPKERVAREESAVEEELRRLEAKMAELSTHLRERGQEHYAARLEQGLEKVRRDRLGSNVREVLEHLRSDRIEKALGSGEEVARALEELLALLEDRADPAEIERKKKALEEALQRLRDVADAERKIREETRELDHERGKEFEQVREDLRKLIREQEELRKKTASGRPRELLEKLAGAEEKIRELRERQEEVAREFESAMSRELKDVGDLARKLGEMIDRQERSAKALAELREREKALDPAAAELDALVRAQEELLEESRKAGKDSSGTAGSALAERQKELNDRTWELGNRLFDAKALPEEDRRGVLEPLGRASDAQDSAEERLREKAYDMAEGDQGRALEGLRKAREALQAMKGREDLRRPAAAGDLTREQERLGEEARKLAEEMRAPGRDPSAGEALERAAGRTDQAAESAREAAGHLKEGRGDPASGSQKQTLERMKEARQELERLQNALAQKDRPGFQGPAEREEDLARQAGELARSLDALSRGAEAQGQGKEAQEALQEAVGEMRSAGQGMERSGGEMKQAQAGSAKRSRDSADRNLQRAEEALREARKGMDGQPEPDYEKLAQEQKELQERLQEKVTKWLEEKARAGESPNLAEAAQESREAGKEMGQAGQDLQGGKPSQAGSKQEAAGKRMKKMEKRLEKPARKPLDGKELEKARELARRQELNKSRTDELEKALEEMGKEFARRSARSAGQNMQRAGKNLEQGAPEEAGEDEEQALEDLRQAEKELEEDLEQIRRMAEEEKLVRLQTELRKLIEVQEGTINRGTRELDAIRAQKGVFGREEVIRSKTLGRTQEDLARDLAEIDRKLGEENVDVFRFVVESVQDDMKDSAQALRDAETGPRTRDVQEDALRKMKELLAAFALRKKSEQEQGEGGGGTRKPELVPDVVQLNMMKKLQENLLLKTRDVRKGHHEDREDLSPGEKTYLRRLSDEQGRLARILRRFIARFEEAGKPAGGGGHE